MLLASILQALGWPNAQIFWAFYSPDLSQRCDEIAAGIGITSRHALHRAFVGTHRLPPPGLVRKWLAVAAIWEATAPSSLAKWALERGQDPATYYRFVRRMTGLRWSHFRRLTSADVTTLVAERLRHGRARHPGARPGTLWQGSPTLSSIPPTPLASAADHPASPFAGFR